MAKVVNKKKAGQTAKPFRILSLDGGGIRGLIPALVLAELEKRTGKPVSGLFDLIAGTSTGGILALALTTRGAGGKPKYSAEDVAAMYVKQGQTIFPKPFWRKLPGAGLADVFDEKYDADGIESVLHEFFGSAKLSDTLTDVLVPAYAIERRDTFFFKTSNARSRGERYNFLVRDVARATSAAPTYFEPAMVKALHSESAGREVYYALVDGGVFANNPAMCAMTEAMNTHERKMSEVVLLSLGTGHTNRPINLKEARGWGLAGWVRPVLSVMMDGMSDSVQYQCRELLPHAGAKRRYARIDGPLIDVDDDMDNASDRNLRDLARFAERLIAQHDRELDWAAKMLTA